MNEFGRFFGYLELRGNSNLNARTVFEIDLAELQVQLFCFTRVDMRLDDELLIVLPFARDRRNQRAS